MKKRGTGVAIYNLPCGLGGAGDPSQATVKLNPDGTFSLLVGSVELVFVAGTDRSGHADGGMHPALILAEPFFVPPVHPHARHHAVVAFQDQFAADGADRRTRLCNPAF